MPFAIRPGTPEDVESVESVRITTWKSAYRGIMPDGYLDALSVDPGIVAQRRNGLTAALADGRAPLFVGELDGSIVGFVNLGRSRDQDIPGGEIFAIYVLPEAQSLGLGLALMNMAVDRLRADGHTELGLWVATDNTPSRRFYERFGLKPSGRVASHDEPVVEETHYRMSL